MLRRVLGFLTFGLPAVALSLASLGGGAGAAPLLQPTDFPTPTPNADGAIIYTVQAGDSIWRIAAIAGLTVEQLQALNGLQAGDFISPGMELVLGSVQPTAAPPPTASPTIEASPVVGTGEICVMLFLDANGNARLDEGELPLESGQVSVADRDGRVAGEHTTDDDPEGHCFVDLTDGDYNVSAAVPPDHNPTTSMNVPVRLNPGDIKFVQFGGQPSGGGTTRNSSAAGGSSLLGVMGLIMLGAAGALGYFAVRSGRR